MSKSSVKSSETSHMLVRIALLLFISVGVVLSACVILIALYITALSEQIRHSTMQRQLSEKTTLRDPYDNLNQYEYFKGKVWLVVGDSISAPSLIAEKTYADYISDWLGVTVINVATSGTGYMRPFREDSSWLDSIGTYPEHVDFITIKGGLNDFEYTLGYFGSICTTTMYGALNIYYKELTERYPKTPIGIITSTPRYTSWGEDGVYVGHINAIIEKAGHYSLPVLDLYRGSGLRPYDRGDNVRFFSYADAPEGDGVHLNDEGQLLIAYKIYDFIVANLR
jgi:lysophospholipase L1-like esterase